MENISALESNQENKSERGFGDFWREHLKRAIFLMVIASQPHTKAGAQEEIIPNRPEAVHVETDPDKVEALRRDSFQKFEELIHDEKIVEKLDMLKKEFGDTLSSFLSVHKINGDMKAFDYLENTKNNPNAFVNTTDPSALTAGSMVHRVYEDRWVHNKEKKFPLTTFSNLELIPDLTLEEVDDFLKKIIPQVMFRKTWLELFLSKIINQSKGTGGLLVRTETTNCFMVQ